MRVLTLAMSTALLAAAVSGCEQLGIPDPAKEHAQKEADGKAVGAACRHAGRAIEDCYTLNPKAMKSAVFAGWKEMNNYMTENKIEVSIPKLTEQAAEEAREQKKKKSDALSGGFPPPEPFITPKLPEESVPAKEKREEKPAKAQ